MSEPAPFLRCPACHAPLADPIPDTCGCGYAIERIGSIPVLLRDPTAVRSLVEERLNEPGRGGWYSDEQMEQWEGPFRHHMRRRVAYVSGLLERNAAERGRRPSILDLGCGDGANLRWLRAYADVLYASDYNALRLQRALAVQGVAAVFMADVTDYPAPDDTFEVIFFNHVLEHIPDDLRALREARRILAKDGLLVIGVPNEGAFFWQLAYRLQPDFLRNSDHVHFYTAASLSARCREAGLTVREVKRLGYGVPHWTLDAKLRQFKRVHDLCELLGRIFIPSQATSLYLIAGK